MMKKILLLFLCLNLGSMLAQQKTAPTRYIFFLHNMFIELHGLEGSHPEYGRAEYKEIVQAFEKQNFTVISEIRPKNTEVKAYAAKVAAQIDSLLKKGVSPGHITVIGTSKGGAIAMNVSVLAKNSGLNFVFIGCCVPDTDREQTFHGNILSIYEQGDTQSCAFVQKPNGAVKHFKETELHTGKKHGFLYKPLKEWIEPSAGWASQEY